ncbi:MAG: hypothetical protein H6765_01135 [Candidatus Peribacteria bacterium]|nr:MAG: hypothetical protein H6765_01135 [Candidatus Peribacteria bacterium]
MSGIGSNKLIIEGVAQLHGTEWKVISDHLDVAGLIAATVMTGGDVTITNAVVEHMGITLQAMEKLGIHLDVDAEQDTIHVGPNQELVIKKTIKGDDLELAAGAWPLLPMDLMPVLLVLAMHCK